jgi:hypothetical protein
MKMYTKCFGMPCSSEIQRKGWSVPPGGVIEWLARFLISGDASV